MDRTRTETERRHRQRAVSSGHWPVVDVGGEFPADAIRRSTFGCTWTYLRRATHANLTSRSITYRRLRVPRDLHSMANRRLLLCAEVTLHRRAELPVPVGAVDQGARGQRARRAA